MVYSLTEAPFALSKDIAKLKQRRKPVGVENTKVALVEPLLCAIGWDTSNIDEVVREYKINRHIPLDYVLIFAKKPCLVIQVKPLAHSLNDLDWIKQTLRLATRANIPWCIFTNGNDYHLYRAETSLPTEERLFKHIRIADRRTRLKTIQLLELLAKENTRNGLLDAQWKDHLERTTLKKAVIDLIHDPPPALVSVIKKRTHLKRMEIQEFLAKARIEVEPPGIPKPQPSPKSNGKGPAVTLRDLINKGVIKPPCPVFGFYQSRKIEATIEHDGAIRFNGYRYDSPSTAADRARISVIGLPHKQREHLLKMSPAGINYVLGVSPVQNKYYQTDGWKFWKTRDARGREVDLQTIRKRANGHR